VSIWAPSGHVHRSALSRHHPRQSAAKRGCRDRTLTEYLDRVLFWNAADLARKLEAFRDYYNGHRVHRAIAGLTPAQFAGALSPAPAALDHYGWQQHCRGLFELPIAT
jgi:transposase InsO family protein